MSQPDELDDVTAERLLRGEVDPSDAPVGYEHLAALIRQAKQPATRQERTTLPALPYAHPVLPAAAGTTAGGVRAARRRGWAVPAAVAAAVVVLSATGAAAANGNLPRPAQGLVSRAADVVGIRLPDGTADESDEVAEEPAASTTAAPSVPVGPPSTVPVGPPSSVPVASPPLTTPEGADTATLCRAYASGQGDANGLLRELYRRATGNEVLDADAARDDVVVLCTSVSVSLPPVEPAAPPSSGPPASTPGQGTPATSGPPASTPGQGTPATSGPPASTPGRGSAPATTGEGAGDGGGDQGGNNDNQGGNQGSGTTANGGNGGGRSGGG